MSHGLRSGCSASCADLQRPIDLVGRLAVLISRAGRYQRRRAISNVGSIPTVSTGTQRGEVVRTFELRPLQGFSASSGCEALLAAPFNYPGVPVDGEYRVGGDRRQFAGGLRAVRCALRQIAGDLRAMSGRPVRTRGAPCAIPSAWPGPARRQARSSRSGAEGERHELYDAKSAGPPKKWPERKLGAAAVETGSFGYGSVQHPATARTSDA